MSDQSHPTDNEKTPKISDDMLIIVPVRNLVLFPGTVLPVAINRDRSLAAAQEAVRAEHKVGFLLQHDPDTQNPTSDDLFKLGTVANIVRYAHGVGPYDAVVHLLPVLVKNGSVYQFRFRFDPALTDLVWKVKASNDLGTWPSTLFNSTVGPIPPLDNGWLPVELPAHLGGGPAPDPKIFARLELQLAP